MLVKDLKLNTIFNNMPTGENKYAKKRLGIDIKGIKNDSVTLKNKVEPPFISNSDLFWGKISDEQIAQINKAKKLPKNARFEIVYTTGGRGGLLTEPFYEIKLYIPFLPSINEETRVLPKGYEVVKNVRNTGEVGAVKIKANKKVSWKVFKC